MEVCDVCGVVVCGGAVRVSGKSVAKPVVLVWT